MKIKKVKFILHNERAKRGMQDKKLIFIFWTGLGILALGSMVLMFDFS